MDGMKTTPPATFDPVKAARDMGATAFKAGVGRAPALDCDVLPLIGKHSKQTLAILSAWLAGWDGANLAAPIPGWTDEQNAALQAARQAARLTNA